MYQTTFVQFFLYYAYYLCTIFADIPTPTYPLIVRKNKENLILKYIILGQLVTQMFKDAHRASRMILDDDNMENVKPFPKPFSREFVLKVNVTRPYVYSQPSPQRMYCRLRQHEFRVAGAFTIDQQFM